MDDHERLTRTVITEGQSNPFQLGRLALLWVLAVIVLAYCVLEMAIANSLFLTKVGAGQLPQVFILIGLGSLPSYLIFTQIVDRYSRTKLFQIALGVSIAIALGLRALITLDTAWVYYLLMVVLFFQWDFHNRILYSSLLTDYFTATEYKQYTPALGIGQALGMLVGGALTSILPHFVRTEDLLYFVPILMLTAIGLLGWLETSQVKLVHRSQDKVGVIEAVKTFPKLIQNYPLMLFLAGSSFLLVIIYLTAEFLWFSVYEQYFTSDQLTQFLGLMRIGVSILQIVVLYCFTRPLLQWIGVSRMNVLYPLTTLISLICFLFNINLWTGIGLHLNGDGLFKSINTPVHQLNYNAIPQEFIGRIRTICDGVVYSTGLISVGVLLLFAHAHLNLTQITWIAICLGVLFFFLRLPMGRFYGAGLEEMIRSNTIDLSQLPRGSDVPIEKTASLIREWLRESSVIRHYQALDLANELNCAVAVLGDILRLQTHNDHSLRQKVLALLTQSSDPSLEPQLRQLLRSELTVHRVIALEALIARKTQLARGQLVQFLHSDVSELQLLGAIAILLQSELSDLHQEAMDKLKQPFGDAAGQAILRVTPYHCNPQQVELIFNRLTHSTQFAIAGLQTLTQLQQIPDDDAWRAVVPFLSHSEPQLRTAAYAYLGHHHPQRAIELYPSGFNDPDASVRETLAILVAQNSGQGLGIAQTQLCSDNPLSRETAIAALGKMKSKAAQDSLYAHLAPDFQCLKQTGLWQKQMPSHEVWHPLTVAIQDFQTRVIHKVFYVLSCLGYESTVTAVNHALLNSNGRDRANAIEVLASFKERRFIRPLLPLLETAPTSPAPRETQLTEKWIATAGIPILESALQTSDPWIQQGALATLGNLPKVSLNQLGSLNPTPILREQLTRLSSGQDSMTQILLLKKVPIFQNLTLDELELIRQELHASRVLATEVIYVEGSWGQYFYVIESGRVELTKRVGDHSYELKRIGAGDYFGEISLFDDAPHWDGAIAAEDCTLLKLEKDKFKALIMQRPRISLEICRYLSQRLREYENFCEIQNQNV